MRIAVCLCGQPRTFETAGPGILRFFEGLDVDYFIHAWTENNTITTTSDKLNYNDAITTVDESQIAKLIEMFNPVDSLIQEQVPFARTIALSQQYSFMQANELKKKHEAENNFQYDIVVKCRFDLIWKPSSKFAVLHIPKKTVFVSLIDKEHKGHGMAFDRFFYGDSETMNRIANIYHYTLPKVEAGIHDIRTMPETIFFKYCQNSRIQMIQTNVFETIVRPQASGLDHIKDFDQIDLIHHDFYNN